MQIICIYQKYFVILHQFFGSEPETNPKNNPKNNETMKATKSQIAQAIVENYELAYGMATSNKFYMIDARQRAEIIKRLAGRSMERLINYCDYIRNGKSLLHDLAFCIALGSGVYVKLPK